ncbi:MAG TPA: flagellar biosynthetic protein FliO [Terriglobales bacterium]|nr:flagellar biosynthetic protein FliO [Terriglobales bacterium]
MSNRKLAIPIYARRALQRLTSLFPFCRSRPPRRLRLCENLQLGERRFLSVVEFGHQKFLVGGTASSLAMLAVLPGDRDCRPERREDLPTWRSVDGALMREVHHG